MAELSILIVDDRPENLGFLTDYLRHLGHRLHCLESGQAALDWLQGEQPDLLLLDWEMPDLDGEEVLEQLAESGLLGQFHTLILSAHSEDELLEDCLEAGADGLLTKPIQLGKLKDWLHRIMSTEDSD